MCLHSDGTAHALDAGFAHSLARACHAVAAATGGLADAQASALCLSDRLAAAAVAASASLAHAARTLQQWKERHRGAAAISGVPQADALRLAATAAAALAALVPALQPGRLRAGTAAGITVAGATQLLSWVPGLRMVPRPTQAAAMAGACAAIAAAAGAFPEARELLAAGGVADWWRTVAGVRRALPVAAWRELEPAAGRVDAALASLSGRGR